MPTTNSLSEAVDILRSLSPPAALYLATAYKLAAKYSDDPRTQTGAVLVLDDVVIGTGVNSLPIGVEITPARLERPKKYQYMEHAERNAIFHAIRSGFCTNGATLYCPWFACCDCARAIIQAGVRKVVGHKQIFDKAGVGPWTESISAGNDMFAEAGVETELYDGPIAGLSILFNGEQWTP
jgi:dCMP deaminase